MLWLHRRMRFVVDRNVVMRRMNVFCYISSAFVVYNYKTKEIKNSKPWEMFFRALTGNTSNANYGSSPGVFLYALSMWGRNHICT